MRQSATALFGPAGTPRVAIVGAGFGGIAAGVKLKQAGIHTFTIYESSSGIGGTWWDNTYPGAEVDVGSHLYSFSFKAHDWSRSHARQVELQQYLEATVDEFGLRPHLQLDATVESATWDDDRHMWTVRIAGGAVDECHVLVSGVGFLNVPRDPGWPGLEDFEGPAFHTARWEHEHDLTGKVVAVVGTGSSATQVVPAIQPIVKQCYVFQREPGWVLPKGERDFDDDERAAYSNRWRRTRERWRLKYLLEKNLRGGDIWRPGTEANEAREQMCRRYIDRQFKDCPELRDAVTPKYPYPGKRPIFATTFYPALKQPNVTLVPKAVASVTGSAIVDADGVEHAVDVIVMATGFQPANYLARLSVVGRDGRDAARALGGRAARLPRHHGRGVPELLHAVRPRHQRRRHRVDARGAGGLRRPSRQAHETRAGDGCRGEAELRGPLVPVAPVEDGRHLLDDDEQLLQVADRQDRDTVAVRQRDVHRAHQAARTHVRDNLPPSPATRGYEAPVTHPFSYQGRRVVVTGAARGVGAALLDVLAELDVAHVTALDLNAPNGPHDAFLPTDLSDEDAVKAAVAGIDGAVHTLFNNAGVADTPPPPVVLSVNYLALRTLSEDLLDRMPEGGAIVNTASIAGNLWRKRVEPINALLDIEVAGGWTPALQWFAANLPEIGQTPYNFTKEVVEVYTLRSSRPTMRRGVRTNTVCPGPIDTPLLPEFRASTSDKIVDWNIREMNGRRGAPARSRRCSRSSAHPLRPTSTV